MTTAALQPSFARGELAPALYGRVDLAVYGIALKTAKNFIVRPYGGLDNRPGTEFIAEVRNSSDDTRLIPFTYSTSVTYVIEAGPAYLRFFSNGGRVLQTAKNVTGATAANPVVVTAVAHGYSNGDRVEIANVAGMTQLNGRVFKVANKATDTFELQTDAGVNVNGTAYDPYTSGGTAQRLAEVTTPWNAAQTLLAKYTQSADVMTFAQAAYAPRELSRTSATEFAIAAVETKEGPFRDLNPNEAVLVAASAATGNVTITANTPIFTAAMVGGLFYLENRNFSNIKPWTPGERGLSVGTLRRSDGKTYRAKTVPSGADWTETGGVRPLHERGTAWDGGGDTRQNGDQDYIVGVEWEYQDSGFGIARITAYTSTTQVSAVVTKNIPAGCVGGAGAPSLTWNITADGGTAYAVAGATSLSPGDYSVTIDGVPVASGFYTGGIGDLPRDGSGDYRRGQQL